MASPLPVPHELMSCRLLIDPPADGAWNMAVDEALLEDVTATGEPVLRFYQWSRPTLSLGYFQQAADRSLHSASAEADLVRRLSGGGAILHDRELTYSLVLPQTHPLAHDTQALYDAVHQTVVMHLRELLEDGNEQWQPELCRPSESVAARDEPFLCFQRRTDGDILLTPTSADDQSRVDHKVVGSAQRRRRGTVLQHGSILLAQSRAAPELPGITNTTHTSLSVERLLDTLPTRIAAAIAVSLHKVKLNQHLTAAAQQLQQTKYLSDHWTHRR